MVKSSLQIDTYSITNCVKYLNAIDAILTAKLTAESKKVVSISLLGRDK